MPAGLQRSVSGRIMSWSVCRGLGVAALCLRVSAEVWEWPQMSESVCRGLEVAREVWECLQRSGSGQRGLGVSAEVCECLYVS